MAQHRQHGTCLSGCQHQYEQARAQSGRAVHCTRPVLGLWNLDIVIQLIPKLFACRGQVVCVFGLSFAHNMTEESQVNIHLEEEYGAFVRLCQYLGLEGDHSHQKRIASGWDQIDQRLPNPTNMGNHSQHRRHRHRHRR